MQVNKEHYEFSSYVTPERWNSYYYQIKEVMDYDKFKTVLVIGKGDGIVPGILKQLKMEESKIMLGNIGNSDWGWEVSTWGGGVKSFDYDPDLNPDIIGDVREIDEIVTQKYDCILCCQVLEHLEWRFFEDIIRRLSLICNDTLILSLPQRQVNFRLKFDIPKIHFKILMSVKLFLKKRFTFNGEHYWEVESKGYPKKAIRRIISKYFTIENEYVVFENPYHWFLRLKI